MSYIKMYWHENSVYHITDVVNAVAPDCFLKSYLKYQTITLSSDYHLPMSCYE